MGTLEVFCLCSVSTKNSILKILCNQVNVIMILKQLERAHSHATHLMAMLLEVLSSGHALFCEPP